MTGSMKIEHDIIIQDNRMRMAQDYYTKHIQTLDVFNEAPIGTYDAKSSSMMFWVEDTSAQYTPQYSDKIECATCREDRAFILDREYHLNIRRAVHDGYEHTSNPVYAQCGMCNAMVAAYLSKAPYDVTQYLCRRMIEQTPQQSIDTIDKQMFAVGTMYKRLLKHKHDMMLRYGSDTEHIRDTIDRAE